MKRGGRPPGISRTEVAITKPQKDIVVDDGSSKATELQSFQYPGELDRFLESRVQIATLLDLPVADLNDIYVYSRLGSVAFTLWSPRLTLIEAERIRQWNLKAGAVNFFVRNVAEKDT